MTANQPEPGCELLVIARDQAIVARLTEDSAGGRVVAQFAGSTAHPVVIAPGAVLIAGPRGARVTARANIAAFDDHEIEFVLETPWSSLDRRAHQRFPARLRSGVRALGESDDLLGVMLDISFGGMAIEVLEDPVVDFLEISTGFVEDPPYVPCEVVRRQSLDDTTILHLRFGALDEAQRHHVASLVHGVRELDQAA